MQCLTDIGAGNFTITSPQPTDYTTCTYILAQQPDIATNAWALTAAQGAQLSIAIGSLLAVGAVIRVLASFLKPNDGDSNE
jgi:hypothetical protein